MAASFTERSWKTTVAGISTILAAFCTLILTPLCDGDPATVAHWDTFMITAGPAIGLLFARDDNKTSEQVGAKKPEVAP